MMTTEEWNDKPCGTPPADVHDQHRFVVTSSEYAHPFLLGAYPTITAALKAQGDRPDKWDIFEKWTPPADVLGLVQRLLIAEGDPEQIYYVDGLYNVCKEAAAALTSLSARVAELEAALQRTEANRDAAMQDAQEEHERAEAALAESRDKAVHEASLFAAELAESIGPSDEWSEDFKSGYVFGGRDAARTIRQKYAFPDAIRAMKSKP